MLGIVGVFKAVIFLEIGDLRGLDLYHSQKKTKKLKAI
jgi:hypothetical protein